MLIYSKGVSRDYLGYCIIIKCYNNFKMLRRFTMLRYFEMLRKLQEWFDSLKTLSKYIKC